MTDPTASIITNDELYPDQHYLFGYVENLKGSLGVAPLHRYPSDPLGALDEQVIERQEFLKLVRDMCKERDIPNEFHVLGLGDRMPERFNPENQIVIASHGHRDIAVVSISSVTGSLSSSDPAQRHAAFRRNTPSSRSRAWENHFF